MIGEVGGQKRGGEVQLQLLTAPNLGDTDVDPLLKEQRDSSRGCSTGIVNIKDRGGNDDLDDGSVPCCRKCLESNCDPDDDLISPCIHKGTQQFVHRSCLDHCRSVKE